MSEWDGDRGGWEHPLQCGAIPTEGHRRASFVPGGAALCAWGRRTPDGVGERGNSPKETWKELLGNRFVRYRDFHDDDYVYIVYEGTVMLVLTSDNRIIKSYCMRPCYIF